MSRFGTRSVAAHLMIHSRADSTVTVGTVFHSIATKQNSTHDFSAGTEIDTTCRGVVGPPSPLGTLCGRDAPRHNAVRIGQWRLCSFGGDYGPFKGFGQRTPSRSLD